MSINENHTPSHVIRMILADAVADYTDASAVYDAGDADHLAEVERCSAIVQDVTDQLVHAERVEAEHARLHDIVTVIYTFDGELHKTPTAIGFPNNTGDRDLAIRSAIAGFLSEDRGGEDIDAARVDFYEMTW